MADELKQENNARSRNLKYVLPSIALIVVSLIVYFFFNPKEKILTKTSVEEPANEIAENIEENNETEITEETNEDSEPLETENVTEEEEEEVKLPDLYIKAYSFNDDPKQNEEVTVKITVGNKGTADARDFEWEWWPKEDKKGCDGDIDFLESGDSKTFECDYTYTGSDTYDSRVVVDSGNDVKELNESNNSDTKEVTPEEELKADLYISEYSFDPVPEKAVPFTVRIGIKNKGNKASGEFYWEWWPTAYNYACRKKISDIAPNSEKVVTCEYTYGGWSTYPTKAVADSDNTVDEFDEDNNSYTENVIPIH